MLRTAVRVFLIVVAITGLGFILYPPGDAVSTGCQNSAPAPLSTTVGQKN